MALEDLPFGPGALVVLGLYVAVLLGIGVWSSCNSTGILDNAEDSLAARWLESHS